MRLLFHNNLIVAGSILRQKIHAGGCRYPRRRAYRNQLVASIRHYPGNTQSQSDRKTISLAQPYGVKLVHEAVR